MFTEIFGNSPRVKLLDFLADHIDFDYTISQLEDQTEISRPTLYGLVDELATEGFILLSREMKPSKFYRLNVANPKVRSMLQLDFESINKKLMEEFTPVETHVSRASILSPPTPRATVRVRSYTAHRSMTGVAHKFGKKKAKKKSRAR